jgi:ligand-binding sensor domain-containing protein/serine phosphatase RsbU (regulator of sigma subunit)
MRTQTLVLVIILLYAGLFAKLLQAQNNSIKFEHLSIEEGLSQSTVNAIIQDSYGLMWFGTIDGLNKFNGYENTIYHHQPDNPYSIIGNSINVIYEDHEGLIWLGTQNQGLAIYNRIKDRFFTVSYTRKSEISPLEANIKAIFEDSEKNMWIGTSDGLFYLNRKTKTVMEFKFSQGNSFSIASSEINYIFEDINKNIWVGTQKGLSRFDKTQGQFSNFLIHSKIELANQVKQVAIDAQNIFWIATTKGLFRAEAKKNDLEILQEFYADEKNNLIDDQINCLLFDQEGLLWLGTEKGGLNLFNPQKNKFISYTHDPTFAFSLSVDKVISLFQDKTGVLWVGTSLGGINKWNKTVQGMDIFRHNPYDSNSLSTSQIRTIFEDKSGIFWVGTVDGGLNKWIDEDNTFTHFKYRAGNTKSLPNNHVRAIFEDSRGNFWVGTDGGGLSLFDRNTNLFKTFTNNPKDSNSLSSNNIFRIYEDKSNQLWIATYGGGINKFNAETQTFTSYQHKANDPQSLSSNYVTCIIQDKNGMYWIGTYGGGINIWDGASKTFQKYENNPTDPNSLGENRIYSILEDKDGIIWVGTKGGGLSRFDPSSKTFKQFTEKDGLPNNVVMGIIEDNNNYLWLSTNGGLCKLNKSDYSTRNYDVNDGLQSNEFLVGSYFKASDGKILFGGVNGLNAFYPENIKDNPYVPDILITKFQVFNNDYELDSNITVKDEIELRYDENFISFEFVALNYIFSEKNQYAYQLEGYDKDWNRVKYRRFANYTNLPPGNYTFRVIGTNNDGVWNEKGKTLRIIIHPAWWQTTIARVGAVLLLILLIFAAVRARIARIENQKKILERLVKERTAEVVAQKEQIQAHLEEIQIQRNLAEKQRDQIMLQKKEITDSIKYAERIQKATLPPENFTNKIISDSFVLFKPKDIVSGDFYWVGETENKLIIAAADCTGHGVPGAFMSMLGISFLNKIVNEKGIDKSDEILNRLRSNVIDQLHQSQEDDQSKDGMDLALVSIDKHSLTLEFSGANNPMYLIRNKTDEIFKPDKMPIAIFDIMDSFSSTTVEMQKGDVYYIFSDGFADQFGGDNMKKLKYKPFREKLTEISHLPMKEQKQILDDFFSEWKGNLEQIDDVLVIGFRI